MNGGTEVQVAKMPPCDMCSSRGHHALAQYDARIMAGPWAGTWGYLCETDWKSYTYQTLGTGIGQRLIFDQKE